MKLRLLLRRYVVLGDEDEVNVTVGVGIADCERPLEVRAEEAVLEDIFRAGRKLGQDLVQIVEGCRATPVCSAGIRDHPERRPRVAARFLLGTTRFQQKGTAAYPAVIRRGVDDRQELRKLRGRQSVKRDLDGVIDLSDSPVVHSSGGQQLEAVPGPGQPLDKLL